ncbi:unnamed protein product [Polarella glacialis]|uniref:Uncharacterized protein n=1 Tax=Polarella glacialis TaxID=89957 RepID=A0A813G9K5_POLGL|nr:unnamed protein product [Polarella glacialis]
MCLLHAFEHTFGAKELPEFWPLVQSMGADVLHARGGLSAAAHISAEMLHYQAGLRPPWVPALSLHVASVASYRPASAEVLLFRFRLPMAPGFCRVLRMLAAEMGAGAPKIVEQQPGGRSLSFQEIGNFRAVAMLPHVPYALRLADVFALGSPTFVPAEPLLHKFIWPFAGPFCGRTDPDLSRSLDPLAANTSSHPYSPFTFQGRIFHIDQYHEDRRYWAQYSEWERWPHLLRFRSARELLTMAAGLTEAAAAEVSAKVRAHHAAIASEALAYWRAAALGALAEER